MIGLIASAGNPRAEYRLSYLVVEATAAMVNDTLLLPSARLNRIGIRRYRASRLQTNLPSGRERERRARARCRSVTVICKPRGGGGGGGGKKRDVCMSMSLAPRIRAERFPSVSRARNCRGYAKSKIAAPVTIAPLNFDPEDRRLRKH